MNDTHPRRRRGRKRPGSKHTSLRRQCRPRLMHGMRAHADSVRSNQVCLSCHPPERADVAASLVSGAGLAEAALRSNPYSTADHNTAGATGAASAKGTRPHRSKQLASTVTSRATATISTSSTTPRTSTVSVTAQDAATPSAAPDCSSAPTPSPRQSQSFAVNVLCMMDRGSGAAQTLAQSVPLLPAAIPIAGPLGFELLDSDGDFVFGGAGVVDTNDGRIWVPAGAQFTPSYSDQLVAAKSRGVAGTVRLLVDTGELQYRPFDIPARFVLRDKE